MSDAKNGNGRVRFLLSLLLTVAISAGGGILAAWGTMGDRVSAAEGKLISHEERLVAVKEQLAGMKEQLAGMNAKLDRLLERRP